MFFSPLSFQMAFDASYVGLFKVGDLSAGHKTWKVARSR